MTWIAVAVIGGQFVVGQYGQTQQSSASQAGRQAAEAIKLQGYQLAEEAKGTNIDVAKLGYSSALSQYEGSRKDVIAGTRTALSDILSGGDIEYGKANLATSGTIASKIEKQERNVTEKAQRDLHQLLDTRALAKRQRDISIKKAEEQETREQLRLEREYQDLIASFDTGGGSGFRPF